MAKHAWKGQRHVEKSQGELNVLLDLKNVKLSNSRDLEGIKGRLEMHLIGFLSKVLDLVVRAHGDGSRVHQDHCDRKELEPSAEDHSLRNGTERQAVCTSERLQDNLCVPVPAWSRICKGCPKPSANSSEGRWLEPPSDFQHSSQHGVLGLLCSGACPEGGSVDGVIDLSRPQTSLRQVFKTSLCQVSIPPDSSWQSSRPRDPKSHPPHLLCFQSKFHVAFDDGAEREDFAESPRRRIRFGAAEMSLPSGASASGASFSSFSCAL